MDIIQGFSKLSKQEKIQWLLEYNKNQGDGTLTENDFSNFWQADRKIQNAIEDFSENCVSNFVLPYGVAPNFLINGKIYNVPMAIEESSVVAAASRAAKYWLARGGFQSEVLSTKKTGQVHFRFKGAPKKLELYFDKLKQVLKEKLSPDIRSMEERGGGILDLQLINKTAELPCYFQLFFVFETCDAMGANFINTVLENASKILVNEIKQAEFFKEQERDIEIIMSILSNYTPECLVESFIQCPIEKLHESSLEIDPQDFANRLACACDIAQVDVYRAVTHNKGIMNGIDAVILASGNDFRAIEAGVHAYAARSGQYRGLTQVSLVDGLFTMSLKIPLAVGTVGGLTRLHPLAQTSLRLMGHPTAKELMQVAAAVGLAQNFSALKSLVTTGIQKGHMKMHLLNILQSLGADKKQIELAKEFFKDRVISFRAVREFLISLSKAENHLDKNHGI